MTFDTRTITLNQLDLEIPGACDEFDISDQSQIEFVVDKAFSNTDLELDLPMEFRNFGVTEIVPDNGLSQAAYIETQSGYFFISEDMMSHINITYARWD